MHTQIVFALGVGLKVGWMTIWITWVTFWWFKQVDQKSACACTQASVERVNIK